MGYFVAACWPSRTEVLCEVHAAWKSAHTLCNVSTSCTYTNRRRKKNSDAMHHLYVFVSQRGGGVGDWGETTSFRF